jgi:hypothetical protein
MTVSCEQGPARRLDYLRRALGLLESAHERR